MAAILGETIGQGFSPIKEMIDDHGEVVLIITVDDEQQIPISIDAYAIPDESSVKTLTTSENQWSKDEILSALYLSASFGTETNCYTPIHNETLISPSHPSDTTHVDSQTLNRTYMCASNLANNSLYTYSPKNPLSPLTSKDTKETSATENEPRYPIYGKKYKPVAKKVKLIIGALLVQFRIMRNITGDPLADMPTLLTNPTKFTLTGRYTVEHKEAVDKQHEGDFLWDEERKLMHHFMSVQNKAFAWDDIEHGKFKEEYFPPVEIPTVPHEPWIQKNIPIPPGIYEDICEQIRTKIQAGVYEPSN